MSGLFFRHGPLFLAIVAAFTLTQCARSSAAVQKNGSVLTLLGPTDANMRNQFFAALDSNIQTVVIRSGGGDDLAAIDIGREIRKRDLRLIIRTACMSACAHFIFLAAREPIVEPASLVIFHNTASSIAMLLETSSDSADRRAAEQYLTPRAIIEKEFYKEIGVPLGVLLQPQIEVQTSCYKFARDKSGNVIDVPFAANFQGWIPRKEFLQTAGIHVNGYWPEMFDELGNTFNAVFTSQIKPHILFGGGTSVISDQELMERFQKISKCG